MKKYIIIILTILLSVPALTAFADNGADSQTADAQNFANSTQELVDNVKRGKIGNVASIFVSITTLIICIGAICTISLKTIKAAMKGEVIDLETIILPFIFAMIISAYQPITQGIDWCVNSFDGVLAGLSEDSLEEIQAYRNTKADIVEQIEKKQAEAMKESGWIDDLIYTIGKYYDKAIHSLVYGTLMTFSFCATFLTKLLGSVLGLILFVLGPIVIALSAIPAFSDNWKNWLAKYIWVQLFTPVCRIISWVLQEVEISVLKTDISRLTYCLNNFDATGGGVDVPGGGFMEGTTYIGFMVVGCILYLAVPSIASWIVNTSGGGVMTAMNTMGTFMMSKSLGAGKEGLGKGYEGAKGGLGKISQKIGDSIKKHFN